VGILLFYLAFHLTLFAIVLITDIISKCKAKCCKDKPRNPVTLATPAERVLVERMNRREKVTQIENTFMYNFLRKLEE